ncbi:hypothetical protein JCM10213_007682 [Rhodosporidiobolus nylandii]
MSSPPSVGLADMPSEVLSMIWDKVCEASATFEAPPTAADAAFIASLLPQGGKHLLPSLYSLLYFHISVVSHLQASRLLPTLALPGRAAYVSRLTLQISPRPLPRLTDLEGQYTSATGVLPIQVAQLATVLSSLTHLRLICTGDGGFAGSPAMIEAIQKFRQVQHVEVQAGSTGTGGVIAALSALPHLRNVAISGGSAEYTFLPSQIPQGRRYVEAFTMPTLLSMRETLETLSLVDVAIQVSHLQELLDGLSGRQPGTSGLFSLPSPPPAIRHLSLVRLTSLDTKPDQLMPVPPSRVRNAILALVQCLRTLHLEHGDFGGEYGTLPLTDFRTGDLAAGQILASMHRVALGGEFMVSPHLFDYLDGSSAHNFARLRELQLTRCGARLHNKAGRSVQQGLSALDVADGLSRPWSEELLVLDVVGMRGEPGWDAAGLRVLRAAVSRMNDARFAAGFMVDLRE